MVQDNGKTRRKKARDNQFQLTHMISRQCYPESARQVHLWILLSVESDKVFMWPETQRQQLNAPNIKSIMDNARQICRWGLFTKEYDKEKRRVVHRRKYMPEELACEDKATRNKMYTQRALTHKGIDGAYRTAIKLMLTTRFKTAAKWSLSALADELKLSHTAVSVYLRQIIANGTFKRIVTGVKGKPSVYARSDGVPILAEPVGSRQPRWKEDVAAKMVRSRPETDPELDQPAAELTPSQIQILEDEGINPRTLEPWKIDWQQVEKLRRNRL